jgi:hypothetical protein
METVTLGETLAGLGTIGVLTAALNVVALRLVRADEVPGCVQARIRWWSAHNLAFLLVSAIVAAAGLTTLMATAR